MRLSRTRSSSSAAAASAGRAVDDLAHRPGVGQAPDGGADALERVQPGDGALVDELAVQPAQLGVVGIGVEGRGERAVGGEDVLGAALQRPGHARRAAPRVIGRA